MATMEEEKRETEMQEEQEPEAEKAAREAQEERKKREELKKKIALCDKLGAKSFQKVVLKAEEIKYRVLKDILPWLPDKYEKYLRNKRDKALRQATTEEERNRIIDEYHKLLLEWKKEIKREKNRNYHMDENAPTEILQYLDWNKKVHKKGLITNVAVITGAAVLLGAEPMLAEALMEQAPELSALISTHLTPVALSAIGLESIGGFINFQCINLQNSHIYRFKIMEKRLKKTEKRKSDELVEKYGALAPVYRRCLEKSIELPTIKDLIANCETPEELQQLKQMVQSRLSVAKKTEHPAVTDAQQDSSNPTTPQVPKEIEIRVNTELERMIQDSGTPEKQVGVQKCIGGIK